MHFKFVLNETNNFIQKLLMFIEFENFQKLLINF